MKKRILFMLLLIMALLSTMSFASYSTVTMSVVEEPVCTIELGENSKFEKKLISKDLTNKEVTLQLEVTNNEDALKPTGEIVLVIDNSNSMNNLIGSTTNTRKDTVFESAKTLVNKLLTNNNQLKISIVSFSSNIDSSKEASLEDANIVSPLTDNIETLSNAISNINANGTRTNLQAGLQLGRQQFSNEDNNKYMIVLTDGVPNLAVGYNTIYYGDEVINRTKNELESLKNNGINIISILTGIENEDYIPDEVTKTFGEIIKEIFGTEENPTAGIFYYVTDTQVEETITQDLYNSLIPTTKTLTDITITDYFPKEIIDNFNFSYITNTNIGNISETIDTTNNSITWTIPELKNGETATVQYKLKLKENFDNNIVGKILKTNENVNTTYTDSENNEQTATSDVTPKLKLVEPPMELPKAGTPILITLAILAIGLLVYSIIKLTIINNKIK